MALEITGKVFKILDVQKGESSRGPWQKGGFVMETESNFPKKVCITVWGDGLNQVNNMKEGDTVKASIDIESREYNDRWYTDVKAWKMENVSSGGGSSSSSSAGDSRQTGEPSDAGFDAGSNSGSDSASEESSDDLPF
jgi:hypothetical protein